MKGPIAIFDILGYQAFLERNPDLHAASEVIDLVSSAPKQIADNWIVDDDSEFVEQTKKLRQCFHTLVFSDTIVCGFELDALGAQQHDEAWAFLVFYARQLYQILFLHGLPIRGCIHHGEFLLRAGCVAGTGVVRAYKFLTEVDMAGVVFTQEAASEMETLSKRHPSLTAVLSELAPRYLCPLKNQKETDLRIVDVLIDGFRDPRIDREFVVRQSFWMLNKDLPESAEGKVHKTKKMMDYLVVHHLQLEAGGGRILGANRTRKKSKRKGKRKKRG